MKKAHPLAMHWEKLQDEKQREAIRYDYEVKKRQQESERRRKRESEEKQQREKIRAQQERQDLQNRRRSLAESWEKKSGGNTNNNNNSSGKESQSSSNIPSKNEIGKGKSPRKSPAVKKVRKCFEEQSQSLSSSIFVCCNELHLLTSLLATCLVSPSKFLSKISNRMTMLCPSKNHAAPAAFNFER